MSALLSLLLSILLPFAHAAPLSAQDFRLHDADPLIIRALGYDRAAVAYFSELASVTDAESSARTAYETVGCFPFYVMKDGKVQEAGYNCGTFFCVGFINGPKQCEDRNGAPYGGLVEINSRLSLVNIVDSRKFFEDFPAADRTPSMQQRIAELKMAQCKPFYLMHFDLVTGEGYTCDEIGRSPRFSGANVCSNDWRTKNGLVCDITYRPDEMDRRRQILGSASGASSSGSPRSLAERRRAREQLAPQSSAASAPSSEGIPSSTSAPFTDIAPGKYGYTAITALASHGIVKGYADGTYRPELPITRAEFLSLLTRSLQGRENRGETGQPGGAQSATSACFRDVHGQWFAPAVCAAKSLGWVAGYPDGRFKPFQTITRAEAMKVVIAALQLPEAADTSLPSDVDAAAWYAPIVRTALSQGLLLEPMFYPASPATRADVAVWMYRIGKLQGIATGTGAAL